MALARSAVERPIGGMAFLLTFLATQKIIKKWTPQKTSFGDFLGAFLVFIFLFIPILGSPRGPQGGIFGYFFQGVFLTAFFGIFSKKIKKIKN